MTNLEQICRICLESDAEDMHQIFEESLSNKIIIITGMDLLQTDSLPKKLCRNCRYQLEKSYYFRMLAKQSEVRLKKYVRLRNQNKDANHVLQRDYKDDDIEEYEEQLADTYCYFDDIKLQIEEEKRKVIHDELVILKSKFESPKKPEKPSIIPKKPAGKPVIILNKCPQNASQSNSVPTLRRKRKADDMEAEVPIEISEVQMVDNGEYEIRILQTDAEGNEEVQLVEIDKSQNQPQFEIISEDAIVEEIHELIEDIPKKVDKKKSPEKKAVQKPQKSSPEPKKSEPEKSSTAVVQDPATEYYFKVIDESEEPEVDENNEKKIFQCAYEDCKDTFSRRQQCKTHYYNHLAVDSNYSCKYCSKKFKVQSALERHERVHNNSKPFICETCNKGFSQKEMLKRHLMIHLPIEEAKFACKICEKRFRQKDPLRQHMLKVHSNVDVPKFQCNLCDKNFAHSSGLSRHLLIHSGKIFPCEICQRQFTDKSALKRHASVHSKS
ncbi:zinc finger protein pita-like [Chironomus tepperi]|uniref:zinc finger protein pita-like n=1 Tax=Chironomus tepperi TaxID=113505 RepID=UPI00391EFEC7